MDSWSAILLPLSLFSAVGRDHKWGGNIHGDYLAGVAVLASFLLTHWEKYVTGVLYLPWLYDITQLVREGTHTLWERRKERRKEGEKEREDRKGEKKGGERGERGRGRRKRGILEAHCLIDCCFFPSRAAP